MTGHGCSASGRSGIRPRKDHMAGLPLPVDILLIRREAGQLSEFSRRDLSALLPLLDRFTLIEFKGPTDVLEPGDVAQLAGCSFLWHSQQTQRLAQADVSLIVLAPNLNDAARDELRSLGWQIRKHQPGIYRVAGGPFTMWLVETDVMAERGQPILSLVSSVFLKERHRIIEDPLEHSSGRPSLATTARSAEPNPRIGSQLHRRPIHHHRSKAVHQSSY